MQTRFQKLQTTNATFASARLADLPLLAAPRPVKVLPEHALSISGQKGKTDGLFLGHVRRPDVHTHSLGYGIDE